MAVDLSVSEMVTEFHIFRPTGPRFVLVLDVSGSMKDHVKNIILSYYLANANVATLLGSNC